MIICLAVLNLEDYALASHSLTSCSVSSKFVADKLPLQEVSFLSMFFFPLIVITP
jgi:hypothetical protein